MTKAHAPVFPLEQPDRDQLISTTFRLKQREQFRIDVLPDDRRHIEQHPPLRSEPARSLAHGRVHDVGNGR